MLAEYKTDSTSQHTMRISNKASKLIVSLKINL